MGIDNNLVEMQTFYIEFYLPKRRSINGFSNSLSLSTFSRRICHLKIECMYTSSYQHVPAHVLLAHVTLFSLKLVFTPVFKVSDS